MRKLTLKKAIELSIIKWEWFATKGFDDAGLFDKYPEIEELFNSCGLCNYYNKYTNYESLKSNCKHCLLTLKGESCLTPGSIFDKWSSADLNTKEEKKYVTQLLELLKIIESELKEE